MGTSEVISTSRGSPHLAVMLCTALLCACATVPRKPAPPVLFANVAPSGFPETVRFRGPARGTARSPPALFPHVAPQGFREPVRFLGLALGFMLAHPGETLSGPAEAA